MTIMRRIVTTTTTSMRKIVTITTAVNFTEKIGLTRAVEEEVKKEEQEEKAQRKIKEALGKCHLIGGSKQVTN